MDLNKQGQNDGPHFDEPDCDLTPSRKSRTLPPPLTLNGFGHKTLNGRTATFSLSTMGGSINGHHETEIANEVSKVSRDADPGEAPAPPPSYLQRTPSRDPRRKLAMCSATPATAAAAAAPDGTLDELVAMALSRDDPELLQAPLASAAGRPHLLHLAAERNAIKCLRTLMKAGYSANDLRPESNETPANVAVRLGHLAALRVLVEEGGASLSFGDDSCRSPLYTAVTYDRPDMAEYLLDQKANKMGSKVRFAATPLHVAAEMNHPRCVGVLLARQVLVDARRGSLARDTALHLASRNGWHQTVALLLGAGADPNARNGAEETPLHLAAGNLSLWTMQMLVEAGADVDARDKDGRPPMHCAVNSRQKGATECLMLLIRKGANLNLRTEDGLTGLHLAILSNRPGRVSLLISAGADLCARNNAGKTPLYFLMRNNTALRGLAAIERRLDDGLTISPNDGQWGSLHHGAEIKMDFDCFTPKSLVSPTQSIQKGPSSPTDLTRPASTAGPLPGSPYQGHFLSRSAASPVFNSDVQLFTEILQMSHSHCSSSRCNTSCPIDRILMHPLSQGYLHLKWAQYRWVYLTMVLSHLVYSITYSVYAVLVYKDLCKPDRFRPDSGHSPGWNREFAFSAIERTECDFSSEGDPAVLSTRAKVAITAWAFLILFNIVFLVKEATKMAQAKLAYLRDHESLLGLALILSFVLISLQEMPSQSTGSAASLSVKRFQFHVSGIGVFMTWLLQMFLVARMPRFGKYIEMFNHVSFTFLNFFLAYAFLFISFAISFYIMFPDEPASTGSLPPVLVKILVMMLGEIEYEDLYYPEEKRVSLSQRSEDGHINGTVYEDTLPQYYPFTAHVLVTGFVIFVSIIIMNLLFGLAVADIQALYKTARMRQLIQQVRLISYMETMLFSSVFLKLPRSWQSFMLKNLKGESFRGAYNSVRTFDAGNPNDRTFSKDLKSLIYEHCLELHQKRINPLSDSQKIEQLSKQVQAMHNLLKKLLQASEDSKGGTLKPDQSPVRESGGYGASTPGSADPGVGPLLQGKKFSLSSLTYHLSYEDLPPSEAPVHSSLGNGYLDDCDEDPEENGTESTLTTTSYIQEEDN